MGIVTVWDYAVVIVVGALLLYSTVAVGWLLLSDYLPLLYKPKGPSDPDDWSVVETGQIPLGDPEKIQRSKERLMRGCEIHTLTEKVVVTSLSDVQPIDPKP